jgi:hypothetical protein
MEVFQTLLHVGAAPKFVPSPTVVYVLRLQTLVHMPNAPLQTVCLPMQNHVLVEPPFAPHRPLVCIATWKKTVVVVTVKLAPNLTKIF